jgi:hypothetical protein
VTADAGMRGDRLRLLDGKAALPPKRPQPYRETPDVTDAIRRLIRALGKRISTEDPESLELLAALDVELRVAWRVAIAGLRRSGFTDREIGQVLGTTRQAVEQRWPRSLDEISEANS